MVAVVDLGISSLCKSQIMFAKHFKLDLHDGN